MFKLFLLTAVILGLAMAGLAIKIWGKKDGQFEGTCASKNVKLKAQGYRMWMWWTRCLSK
jgi:hypothetical protein